MDCGSSLNDSFELKSIERQLHSAISSRTLSIPRLSNHHHPPPLPPSQKPPQPISKKSSIFSLVSQTSAIHFRPQTSESPLSTILQVSESGSGVGILPEFKSMVVAAVIRKSAFERFIATTSNDL
ncbi:hypothetical protein CsSME_00015274 [Camellia sinensis var. sinensis]